MKNNKIKNLIKYFSLIFALVFLNTNLTGAVSDNKVKREDMPKRILTSKEGVRNKYKNITFKGKEYRIYDDTNQTVDELIKKYPKEYEYYKKRINKNIIDISTHEGLLKILDCDEPTVENTAVGLLMQDEVPGLDMFTFCSELSLALNKIKNDRFFKRLETSRFSEKELEYELKSNSCSLDPNPEIEYDTNKTMKNSNDEKQSNLKPQSRYYNRDAAVNYAKNWWAKTNNTQYPYYANYNNQPITNYMNDLPSYITGQYNIRRSWHDCTNFVSQCLKAGGMQEISSYGIYGLKFKNYKNWFYDNSRPSHTWGGAENLTEHLKWRFGYTKGWGQLNPGDIVAVDLDKNGIFDHMTIVTKVKKTPDSSSADYKLAYHTEDHYNIQEKSLNSIIYNYDYYCFLIR